MKSLLLGCKSRVRYFGVALATAGLFAAACGGSLNTIAVPTPAAVTVLAAGTTPPPPPTMCGSAVQGYMVCVNPDPLNTSGNVGDDVEITWTLATSGWSFDQNKGIDIKNKKNWKVKRVDDLHYNATNKKEGNALYKYDINVTNGSVSPSYDPTIMN
jgi:hypothetical protein